MRLLTTREERLIRMPENERVVSRKELLLFPVIGVILCCFLAPASIPLLGTFFFGNLMRVSGVVDRLAKTASSAIIDTATIFLGFTVGASTQGDVFLTPKSVGIFALGAVAFSIATYVFPRRSFFFGLPAESCTASPCLLATMHADALFHWRY